jgi:hypothetical protein
MSNHALPSARKGIFSGAGNKPANLPPGTPDPVLVGEVRAILETRYERRLGDKLADREPVKLRIMTSTSGTAQESADTYIILQDEEVRAAIGDIFTRANGRLLLLGLPGAGKTTIVLQLAMHLLRRQGTSIPVVLNLATWRPEFTTIEDWLLQILPAELATTSSLAEQIRKNIPLILLLDGLDELPEADRASCLTAIGEYGADAKHQFLISSRIDEYAATKDAPVNAQIEVAPLTIEQVELGLAATANIQPESKRLLNALKTDPLLRKAVENPFYLNTAQLLFASGKNWSEYEFAATDVAGREQELVERFIESALSRKVRQEFPADQSRHWLSFLASRMTERNMVAFELRDLQYDWWKWSKKQIFLGWMGIVLRIIFKIALPLGMFFGMLIDPWMILYLPLSFVFIMVLVTGLMVIGDKLPEIMPLEGHRFHLGINNEEFQKLKKDPAGTIFMTIFWCVSMGIAFSLAFGIKMGFVFGLISSMVAIGSSFVLSSKYSKILMINKPYKRFTNSLYLLDFTILQHILLRYQLYCAGLLPLRLVAFLNELSLRHILEFDGDPHTGKGGGAWRFRHRILQEYFEKRWVEPAEHQKM